MPIFKTRRNSATLFHRFETRTRQSGATIGLVILLVCVAIVGCGRGKKGGAESTSNGNGNPGNTSVSNPNSANPRLPDVPPVVDPTNIEEMDQAAMIQALGHQDLKKRYAAADRLAADPKSSLPLLLEALAADNYHVRAGAAFTLGKMGVEAESALPVLSDVRSSDERNAVRDSAAYAIEAIRSSIELN